jgi:RNA polymerase sigma factor (sigma-70 family)
MSLLDNIEIQEIYKRNEGSSSTIWMTNLFFKLRPLVISRIKKFKTFSHVADLEQEMNLALWSAIKSFDCHRNFDFYRWSNWHFSRASRDFQKRYATLKSINLDDKVMKRQDDVVLAKEVLNCRSLDQREKRIIFLSFVEDETLTSIGSELGVSAERVRVLKNRAILKIKDFMEANNVEFSS